MKTKKIITNISLIILVLGAIIGLNVPFYEGSIFSVDFIEWLMSLISPLIFCLPFAMMIGGCIYFDKIWILNTLKRGKNRYLYPSSVDKTPISFTDDTCTLRRTWMIITLFIICISMSLYAINIFKLDDSFNLNVNTNTSSLLIPVELLICILVYIWSVTNFRTGNWALAGGYLLLVIFCVYRLYYVLKISADFMGWVLFIFGICIIILSMTALIKCIKYAFKREENIRIFQSH